MMKRLALIIFVALMTAGSIAWPASAIPSDEVIKMNCQSVQSVLNQLEKVDAALRINRGRVYNEVLDLLYAMNSRLAGNKIAAPKLAAITANFDDRLEQFRSDYNEYDDTITELIKMNCQKDPGDFYDKLTAVRQERNVLNEHIDALDELIEDYQAEFDLSVRILVDAK